MEILGQPVQFPPPRRIKISSKAYHRAPDSTTSTTLDGDVGTASPVSPNKNDTDASPRTTYTPSSKTTKVYTNLSGCHYFCNCNTSKPESKQHNEAGHTSSRSIFFQKDKGKGIRLAFLNKLMETLNLKMLIHNQQRLW